MREFPLILRLLRLKAVSGLVELIKLFGKIAVLWTLVRIRRRWEIVVVKVVIHNG